MAEDLGCQRKTETLNLSDFIDGRTFDPPDAAKMFDEGLPPHRPNSRDSFKTASQRTFMAELTTVRIGKSMSFVPHPLHEVSFGGIRSQLYGGFGAG